MASGSLRNRASTARRQQQSQRRARARGGAQIETLEVRKLMSAGDLDTSWGNGGYGFADFGQTSDLATGVAVQTFGTTTKIVTAGIATVNDQNVFAVSRHNSDGSQDTSFNGGNPVLTSFGAGLGSAGASVAIDNQQRIIVVGRTDLPTGGSALSVARYLSNGQADASFGNNGTILFANLHDPGNGNESIDSVSDISVTVDTGNRVVIGMTGVRGNSSDMYVVRLTDGNGALDLSFGQSGIASTNVGTQDFAGALAIDGDGNIVQAGFTATGADANGLPTGNLITARYAPSGSTGIQGYGNGGVLASDVRMDGVRSAFLDADGSLVVAGVTTFVDPSTGFDSSVLSLARVAGDGSSVLNHVSTGLTNDTSIWNMAVQRDGKIVVAADNFSIAKDPEPAHYIVARFNPDFLPDLPFGDGDATPGDGIYTSTLPGYSYATGGVVIDGSDQIVVAGFTFGPSGSDDFLLARHEGAVVQSGGGDTNVSASAGGIDNPDDASVHNFYTVQEGHSVTLHGAGLAVQQGAASLNFYLANQHRVVPAAGGGGTDLPVVLSWDINGDGVADFNGSDLTLTGVDDGIQTATLRVALASNPSAILATSTATVQVTNVAPRATIQLPTVANEGQPVTLVADAQDVPADVLTYDWTITGAGQTLTGHGKNFTFTPADNGSYTVNLHVEDDDHGTVNAQPTTLTVANVAPVVSINTTTTQVNEGQLISFTTNPQDVAADSASFSYLWTVTRGGVTFANGTAATFAFTPDDNGAYKVNLTVTDKDGGHGAAQEVAITANNVAPTANVTGDTVGLRGASRTLNLGATDPGAADVAAGFTYTVNWADGSPVETYNPGTPTAAHVYANNGTYNATVTATDHDHAASQPFTIPMVTQTAILANGTLTVAGTTGSDTVNVTRNGNSITLNVSGSPAQTFTGATRLVVNGGDGSDIINVAALNIPVEVYGGAGNDIITAGGSADILVGGAGSDVITGGAGRDLIIGGQGSDLLSGDSDEDILIGGYTAFDADPASLRAISNEWQSSRTYEQRIANLRGPITTGVNGHTFLREDVTVWDEQSIDIVNGGSGRDWFFVNNDGSLLTRDLVTGAGGNETITDIDPHA